MKKTIFLLIALGGLPAAMSSCSNEEGENKVETIAPPTYAASDKIWKIDNDTLNIHQLWSDAIAIPACNKEDFDGGSKDEEGNPIFKADCRNNPGYAGYLYSWNYVNENAASLCPSPWRVPTTEDFVNLDKALGGNGSNRDETSTFINANYIDGWGGVYGGYATGDLLRNSGRDTSYWSSTEYIFSRSWCLLFEPEGAILPRYGTGKYHGFQVRCVK